MPLSICSWELIKGLAAHQLGQMFAEAKLLILREEEKSLVKNKRPLVSHGEFTSLID